MTNRSHEREPGIPLLLQGLASDLDFLAIGKFQLALHEIQPDAFRLIRIALSLGGLAVLALVLAVLPLVCPRCRVASSE